MAAVRGVVLESQYLLEPCGTGRTRLTHISRVDLRCGQASSVLTLKGLNHHCDHYMHSLLVLVTGEGPQNGTTRLLATCVLMRPRWSAPPFICWIRRALRLRSDPPESGWDLGHTSRTAGPENQWSRRGIMHPVEIWCHYTGLSHTVLSHSHTEENGRVLQSCVPENHHRRLYLMRYNFLSIFSRTWNSWSDVLQQPLIFLNNFFLTIC